MKRLLFICGFPSGGTDLTKTVLNAHPDIYINGEMPFLKNLVQYGYKQSTEFTNVTDVRVFQNLLKKLDEWHNIENVDHDFNSEIKAQGKLKLDEVLRICFSQHDVQVWGNKTPQNTENIKLLSELFPSAYFLVVTRDVRDVCLSWQNKWGKDMLWCATKWAERMPRGQSAAQNLSSKRYLFIRFEDLLSDTALVCKKVCHFLAIPFSDRMLEHHKHTARRIDGKLNYGQPVRADNKRKWATQLPAKTVRRIEEIAFEPMNLFGYQLEFATSARPMSFWETWRGKWNDFWALLLVGNRASQENGLGRRFQNLIFEFKKRLLK